MARPIEPTPTLEGKDAELFYESLEKATYNQEKDDQLKHARKTYETLKRNWHTTPVAIKK